MKFILIVAILSCSAQASRWRDLNKLERNSSFYQKKALLEKRKIEKNNILTSCLNAQALFSYVVSENENGIEVEIFHINKRDRPFHEGSITNRDLEAGSFVKAKQALLNQIPSFFKVNFSREKCDFKQGKMISCREGKLDTDIPSLEKVHFSVTNIVTTMIEFDQEFFEKHQSLTLQTDKGFNFTYNNIYYPKMGDWCE
jgi:hypothetical protein